MSQDEIKRILELETRLGVLSAINYTFPFAGQSRPVYSRRQVKKEDNADEENRSYIIDAGFVKESGEGKY